MLFEISLRIIHDKHKHVHIAEVNIRIYLIKNRVLRYNSFNCLMPHLNVNEF